MSDYARIQNMTLGRFERPHVSGVDEVSLDIAISASADLARPFAAALSVASDKGALPDLMKDVASIGRGDDGAAQLALERGKEIDRLTRDLREATEELESLANELEVTAARAAAFADTIRELEAELRGYRGPYTANLDTESARAEIGSW